MERQDWGLALIVLKTISLVGHLSQGVQGMQWMQGMQAPSRAQAIF